MVPGGRSGAVLRAVPGMADFAEVGDVFVRAMSNFDGGIMAIVGTNLHRVQTDGTVTLIGDVDATDAIAGLDQSTGYVVAVAGRKYWHWNGTTLATVVAGNVPNGFWPRTLLGFRSQGHAHTSRCSQIGTGGR